MAADSEIAVRAWQQEVVEVTAPAIVRNGWLYSTLKRLTDLTLAVMFLLMCLPFWPLIALAIKLESAGPVFFRQRRPGKGGTPFVMFKFRTMCAGAEQQLTDVMHLNLNPEPGPVHISNDPRITRIGMLLRKTSLDETPQLINVLKGEMSFVGPRPLIEPMPDPRAGARLAVIPGLTGMWQIRRRGNDSTEFLLQCDMEYLATRSLWVDLGILLRTPFAMLRRDGSR